MAQIGNYDANHHEPAAPREVLPAGWYAMQIVKSEVRETKDHTGRYLWLEFEIVEAYHPHLKGRKTWDRLNMWITSEKAVDIANRQMSSLCRATGQMQVQDSDQLHNKPVAVKLKVRPTSAQFDEQNDVTGYEAVGAKFQPGVPVSVGTSTPQPGQAPAAAAVAPPVSGQPGQAGAPPWTKPTA